jgi:AcrR family transcriptional regulator
VPTSASRSTPARTQVQRSQATRKQILDGALQLMLRSGYSALRFAELARVAGVSRGAILHHFPTKLALVGAAIEYAYEKALAGSRNRAQRLKPYEDPFEAMIADAREFYFSDFFFVLANMVVSGNDADRRLSRDMSRTYRLPVEQEWQSALVARGFEPQSAEDAVWLTLGLVRGMALRTLFQNEPDRFDRLFALFREIFWTYRNATAPNHHEAVGRKTKTTGRKKRP